MENMDKVDAEQQKEIVALQKKDVRHDRDLFWLKMIGTVVVIFGVSLFAMFMTLADLVKPFNCPHDTCPHHQGYKP